MGWEESHETQTTMWTPGQTVYRCTDAMRIKFVKRDIYAFKWIVH